MTAFLAWVYAQANKVYDWFGSSYQALRNAAANAWTWAVERANAAYQAAVSYAHTLIQQVQGGITASIDWIFQTIYAIRDNILEDVTGLFDWVEMKFTSIRDVVLDVIGGVIGNIATLIDDARTFASSLFDNVVTWVQQWAWSAFGWIDTIKDNLLQVLSMFTPEFFQTLTLTIEKMKNGLLAFLDNPVEFMLDMIWTDFLAFLEFVLAHALGTTIHELPSNPPWKR